MGVGPTRLFQRSDAGCLIGVDARPASRIDPGHAIRPACLRIEVGVEHALTTAELQLEAVALADLECRIAEMADKLLRSEPEKLARLRRSGRLGELLLDRFRLNLRAGRAGGKEQGRGEDETAHMQAMPCRSCRGNIASA